MDNELTLTVADQSDLLETIGRTPIVQLAHFSPNPDVRIFAKLEGWNPMGSVKDRIVREIVREARAIRGIEARQRDYRGVDR